METQKINAYVDNLDVNTQADLLKKVLLLLFDVREYWVLENGWLLDNSKEIYFIEKQIEEFNEQYNLKERPFEKFI